MNWRGFICVWLLLFIYSLGLFGSFAPRVETQEMDLNQLIQTRFDEWMAWLTRRLSLNGTTSETFDYSRVSAGHTTNNTLSFPSFLLALTYMYEGTNNEFYLRKLQSFIDGAIDNNMFYITVPGIGEIFFPLSWYYDGSDQDPAGFYPAIFGYIATRLYLWTGSSEYKTIADRIASESYDKLAVIKNSTDIAWSWAYHYKRDETNARIGVNRQTFFAWFYALYGKHINSTFTPFVSRIINWVWRSQLADNSLSYNIGDSATNKYYTGFSVWATLHTYLIDSSSFSTALKDKIKNTVIWLNSRYQAQYEYQSLYHLVPALNVALKTDYFASSVSSIRAKSMLYVALRSMHLTTKGFVTRLDHYSFGFRWHQLQVSGLFTLYPLTDYTLDMSKFNPITTYQYASGNHYLNGWAGGIFATEIRDGRDYYGSQITHCSGRSLHFNPAGYQLPPTSVSITNNTYYVKIQSTYSTYITTYYVYPSGVFVGDVTGTTTANIVIDNKTAWQVRVANGSEWQVTSLTSGNVYNFGTKFLLYVNDASLANRRSFFVKGPTSSWKYTFLSSLHWFNFSETQTNFRIVYAEIGSMGHLIPNAGTMFTVLDYLADAHDTNQPVSFETSFNAYHNKITELEADASWNTLYQTAHSTIAKLIGHNLPEKVSITSWDCTPNTLSFTIDASSGATSTTKVYVGDNGEPTRVYAKNGTLTWSYDASTKTLELSVMHLGPAEIMVDWGILGDVNHDGTVNIFDIGTISSHWYPGPPIGPLGYDPIADINYDGAVDILDVGIASAHWTGP